MSIQKSDTLLEAFTVNLGGKKKPDAVTFRVLSSKDIGGRMIDNIEWTYVLGIRLLSNNDLYNLMLLMDYLKDAGYHLKLSNP